MRSKAGVVAVVLMLLFTACRHEPVPQPAQVACRADTITTVSFSKDVLPILTGNCALAGCHSGGAPKGHLNLDAVNAYGQLWQSGSGFIDTESVTSSLLYSQLISVSDPMPPTGRLDSCSISLIKKWIEQKGKNN